MIFILTKIIVSDVARSVLNTSIYPSQEEFRSEAQKIVSENHPEFYAKFRKKWAMYYEKNIYQRVNFKFFNISQSPFFVHCNNLLIIIIFCYFFSIANSKAQEFPRIPHQQDQGRNVLRISKSPPNKYKFLPF